MMEEDHPKDRNINQLRIDRPHVLEDVEEEEINSITEEDFQNNANEASARSQGIVKLFEVGDLSVPHSSTSSSPHPIQTVHPIVNSSSVHSFSTITCATPPMSLNSHRLRFNLSEADLKDDKEKINRRCTRAIQGDRNLLRLKSLKSVKRHNRDDHAIILREEEEEEEVEERVETPIENEPNEHSSHTPSHSTPIDWIEKKEARGTFFQYFTFLYALLLIVYLTVDEATFEHDKEERFPSPMMFHYYMFGVAIIFLIYINLFIIHPPWFNRILYFLSDRGIWSKAENYIVMPATHNAEPVSTLYLRMGTLLFGCASVVLYGLELYLLFSGKVPFGYTSFAVAENILGIIFIFFQMYFMNVNFKLLIKSSQNICRFGFMHMFALNLWTWYKFASLKQNKTKKKQLYKEQKNSYGPSNGSSNHSIEIDDSSTSSSSEMDFNASNHSYEGEELLHRVTEYLSTTLSPIQSTTPYNTSTTTYATTSTSITEKNSFYAIEYFGGFSGVLNTCIVEYSLIGAAVMFVFWKHLDPAHPQHEFIGKKSSVRVDFTATLTGLYLGVIIFVLGAVSCGIYAGLYNDDNPYGYIVFGVYELICFITCTVAVMAGTIFMRSLVLSGHRHGEDVDEILLYVAFVGEIVWCSADLSRFIDIGGDGFVFAVTLVRLSHVIAQTWFILHSCKLELAESTKVTALRGRQCVTFLLVTNITLFLFHIYESMTDGFGYSSATSSTHSYVKLMASPLIAFYRFHCSVCFAEIWKKTFTRPKAHHGHDHGHGHHDHEKGDGKADSLESPSIPNETHHLSV